MSMSHRPSCLPQRCQFYPGLPSPKSGSLCFRICIFGTLLSSLTRAWPGRKAFLLAWMVENYLILSNIGCAGHVYAAPPKFISPKVCNFLHVWPVRGAFAVSHMKPQDFVPH